MKNSSFRSYVSFYRKLQFTTQENKNHSDPTNHINKLKGITAKQDLSTVWLNERIRNLISAVCWGNKHHCCSSTNLQQQSATSNQSMIQYQSVNSINKISHQVQKNYSKLVMEKGLFCRQILRDVIKKNQIWQVVNDLFKEDAAEVLKQVTKLLNQLRQTQSIYFILTSSKHEL